MSNTVEKRPGHFVLVLRATAASCPIFMALAACWILIVLRNSEVSCANFASRYTDTLNFYNFAYLAGPWLVAGIFQLIRFHRPWGLMDLVGILGAIVTLFSLILVAPYLATRVDMINCNLEGYAVWRERFFFDVGVVVATLGKALAVGSILIGGISFVVNGRKKNQTETAGDK